MGDICLSVIEVSALNEQFWKVFNNIAFGGGGGIYSGFGCGDGRGDCSVDLYQTVVLMGSKVTMIIRDKRLTEIE